MVDKGVKGLTQVKLAKWMNNTWNAAWNWQARD